MNTTTARTKDQELAALQQLAADMGPNSYLGPWLMDAYPWLADQLRSDYMPQRARAMAEEAARVRAAAYDTAAAIRKEAREQAAADREQGRKEAAALIAAAQNEADRIKGNAWQAIRRAMQAVEA